MKAGHTRDTLSSVGSHPGAGWYPQSKPAVCLGPGARAEGEICEYTHASYDDVRIWDGALTTTDLELLHDLGPDM